ncbi:IS1380 family transposase [Streptomyces europaeiscabiei]|uniref:IS1380 family transposase n=1 Tax=Streptomyces europaeiscabiei TaxID=146819 RepID=UPI0029A0CD83|nr:IS1380 family transposase [Streptomyces europaeiscabiei]MDX2769493.1 IS1380 family transposase [Streptomyces europaeiscabiei]
MSEATGWDRRLRVRADGKGLVGHAGAVLLRRCADRVGLTGALAAVLPVGVGHGWRERAAVVVHLAVAIVLGAANLSEAEQLGLHHRDVFGSAVSDSTTRRTLAALDESVMMRMARVRRTVRQHVWSLLHQRPGGFPWLSVAGRRLKGWIVVDMDATVITAASKKERAAATFKGSFGSHPLAAWCANTSECLAMELRPGNAGANTVADHLRVLAAALTQIPRSSQAKLLVRVDGAGATHGLLEHLVALNTARRTVRFSVGWKITDEDEAAIAKLPETAWETSLKQDGSLQEGYFVAELTGLNTREGWPEGTRLIVRRVKPSGRQVKKLTDFERGTGWRYSITATNIGRMWGIAGSHQPQFLDALHRDHAEVEDRVRTNKAMGLHNLPSKSWDVNCGWMLAANLAADLDAWVRLLGLHDVGDLADAEIDTMRFRLYHVPARLTKHARRRWLHIEATWPWADAFTTCWRRLCELPAVT